MINLWLGLEHSELRQLLQKLLTLLERPLSQVHSTIASEIINYAMDRPKFQEGSWESRSEDSADDEAVAKASWRMHVCLV